MVPRFHGDDAWIPAFAGMTNFLAEQALFNSLSSRLREAGKRNILTAFLRRKMIDAKSAWYLKGTEIGFCCEPYWLSFASKEEAEKFAKGFGGKVLSYDEALKDLEVGEKKPARFVGQDMPKDGGQARSPSFISPGLIRPTSPKSRL